MLSVCSTAYAVPTGHGSYVVIGRMVEGRKVGVTSTIDIYYTVIAEKFRGRKLTHFSPFQNHPRKFKFYEFPARVGGAAGHEIE